MATSDNDNGHRTHSSLSTFKFTFTHLTKRLSYLPPRLSSALPESAHAPIRSSIYVYQLSNNYVLQAPSHNSGFRSH